MASARFGEHCAPDAEPCCHPPFCRPRQKLVAHEVAVTCGFPVLDVVLGGESSPYSPVRLGSISPGHSIASISGGIRRPRDHSHSPRSEPIFGQSGAGGNRTPVHQATNVRATTIPDSLANAARPAGRLTVASGGPRSVFAECQQTFLRPAFFLAVIPRFCCRAAVDRPRAPFLVTMSLHSPD